MNFLDISRKGHGIIDFVPDFLGNVLCDVPATHVDKFLLLHSGYSIVSRVSVSAVILTPDFSNFAEFRQLQIPNALTKYCEIFNN